MGYKSPIKVTISGTCFQSTNLVDNTSYYFGDKSTIGNQGYYMVYLPVSGVLRIAQVNIASPTATGTNEAWTIVIRKNNTTDYTFATVTAATANRNWSNSALSIPIVQGDYIEFKMTTPTWVTNPEGCRATFVLIIDID